MDKKNSQSQQESEPEPEPDFSDNDLIEHLAYLIEATYRKLTSIEKMFEGYMLVPKKTVDYQQPKESPQELFAKARKEPSASGSGSGSGSGIATE